MKNDEISRNFPPPAATSLVGGGVLFALYQFIRPFTDTAETMASTAWLASHLFAIGGFILIGLGLLWLPAVLRGTRGHGPAIGVVVTVVLGTGLTLPYYGAETFMLRFAAQHALSTGDEAVLVLADTLHSDTTAMIIFAVGLLLLGIAAVLVSVAIGRSGMGAVWSTVPLALGYALLIPQFWTPQPVRMVHGVLVALGCVLVAVALSRASRASGDTVPTIGTAPNADAVPDPDAAPAH